MIGIIGAMDEEVEILKNSMTNAKKHKKASMEFVSGKISEKEVVVVTSGIGKVNAAVCTQIIIDDFSVDRVINVGVAGGIGENIKIFDIVIGDSLLEHDIDATIFGYRKGQIPRMDVFDFKSDEKLIDLALNIIKYSESDVHVGRIISGDQFISSKDKIEELRMDYGALAVEMEGASIAHVCHLNNIPFVIIRSISDNAANDAHINYEIFKKKSIDNSIKLLNEMMKNI